MAARRKIMVRRPRMDKSGIPLRDVVSEYLQYHDGLNHSPATTRWYADILLALNRFLGEEATLGDLTVPRLRAYQSHLRSRSRRPDDERPLSDETLHGHARGIRTFLSWLHREGYLDEDLARRIDLPRVGTKQLEVLTEEEIARLFQHLPLGDDQGCRNAAIVALMVDCGLRLSEVAGLDVDDVDLEDGLVRVLGKGRRQELVPFGSFTRTVLRRWIQHYRRFFADGTPELFPSPYGGRLTAEGIKSMVQRLAERCGIERLHPHLLRHTAATRLLANGCDLHTVQRILRHRQIETTTRYLHLLHSDVQEKMRTFSPMDRLQRRKAAVR